MKKPLVIVLALTYLAFLPAGSCGNPSPKPIPTEVDAGPSPDPDPVGDTCDRYCNHLSDLQCSEGTNPKCKSLCNKVFDENLIRLPIDCVMEATTKNAAIKCGASCK